MPAEVHEEALYMAQLQWVRSVDIKDNQAVALCAHEAVEMEQREEITKEQRLYIFNVLLERIHEC